MKTSILTILAALFALSSLAQAVDLHEIEEKLTTTGVEGEVHGASPTLGIYVFNYRNPNDFFDYLEMSVVSDSPEVMKQLATLGRHDRIKLKGAFLHNPSPQKHINVASLEIVKKFQSSYPVPAYEYEARLPDELIHKDNGTFLVHALHADGHILVVEYKDAVMPIFVRNAELTKNLYRGDLIQLSISLQEYPDRPSHLKINETAAQPVRVLESVRAKHGTPVTVEGALILFPKSPEIKFNVFAVLQTLPEGLKRQFTLVNFDSPEAFKQLREALQKSWDKFPGAYVNGRNKLVSTRIRVKATGTFNEVDPNQANPQILMKSLESIEIIEK